MWKEAVSLAAVAGAACVLRSEYKKKHFSVGVIEVISPKLEENRNLIFLSDLHNNEFGQDNGELVAVIHRLHLNTVLSGGDTMVYKGRRNIKIPLKLLHQLTASYPVYCSNGNHEGRTVWERSLYGDFYEEHRDTTAATDVHYLEDSFAFLGRDLGIAGLDLSFCFYRKALYQKTPLMPEGYAEWKPGKGPSACKEEPFIILLAHSSLCFDSYVRWGVDLTLAGHFHGDTARIPELEGVMTPQYQFFLPWCAGDFGRNKRRVIVSRGLGTYSINIRPNSRPQLVLVRLRRA